jgi:hypothetical protein
VINQHDLQTRDKYDRLKDVLILKESDVNTLK